MLKKKISIKKLWKLFYPILLKSMKAITEETCTMAKCPKCGTDVAAPKKTWKMAGRPDKAGKRMQLEIGLYECSKCSNVFREVLSKNKI
jgi:predicted RNA-binding Zn-ribbon protein involved in translation (DUF1610 family)